ncbi:putative Outer membrane autotransporter [Hyphomicrobium sp. MC1]|nr:putative Outer membrane autotransporter [Hyphomicrobium sp. MC1]
MGLFDPPPPGNMTTSTGKISDAAYAWFRSLGQSLSGAVSGLSTVQGQTESGTFSISFPVNQSYRAKINSAFGFTITSITSRCASGTCTATWNISGTDITATPNSVSTSANIQTPTGNNVVAVGQNLNCVISANSSCQYAIFEIAYTRT